MSVRDMTTTLRTWRCDRCNTKLAEYQIAGGSVSVVIRCHRCGTFNAKSVIETIIAEQQQETIASTRKVC